MDDVAEHEVVGSRGDSPEEVVLGLRVQVVHRERRDDEVEWAFGQRILEARETQVGVGKSLARTGQHRLVRVDARPALRADARRRLSRPCPELEHGLGCERVRGRGDGILELLVARDLLGHLGQVRLGIPLVAAHGADHTPG